MDEIADILEMLSSRRVLARKEAIKMLRRHLRRGSHMAGLSLLYVADHDPCYTVRNMARQAYYCLGAPPDTAGAWEKAYLFQKE